ncbi:putative transposase [Gigaspora margarita]|uniref:Putative transposase n=1 Tax=Gigaspora margarita TaxID=4874 RepID=A0A8H4ET41_GIGMA|nr:putative transposase [Gigaspora margarita]
MRARTNYWVLQDVAQRVKAFRGFFLRLKSKTEKAGYPRFKSFGKYDSFTYSRNNNSYKLEQEKLRLASIGKVKIKLYRELEGEVKTCSIIVKNSKYYAWLNDDQSLKYYFASPILKSTILEKSTYIISKLENYSTVYQGSGILKFSNRQERNALKNIEEQAQASSTTIAEDTTEDITENTTEDMSKR